MREIKFRALVPVNTNGPYRMEYFDLSMQDDLNRMAYADYDIRMLMEFTGLKDKNMVEIFEGDICLKYWSEEVYGKRDPAKGVVKWVSFGGRYTLEWSDEVGYKRYEELYENLTMPQYVRSQFEVIGNIYQNPELLNTSAS